MKANILIVLTIIAVLLAACGSATPSTSTTTTQASSQAGPAETQSLPTAPASAEAEADVQPIKVEVTLDESASVEALIPLEGGTLALEAADGARYTLNIPETALLEPVLVRMTPVAQLSGLPFGAPQTYAVDLQPEGLVFYDTVTLTIETPVEIPIQEQLFFGYQQEGKEVFLAPPDISSQEMKILLTHFSGYGVTKGLLADVEPLRQRLGGSDETRLQSQMAELVIRERQRIEQGGDDGIFGPEYEQLVQEWYEKVVKPRVAAAGESCAAGRLAVDTVLHFQRQLILTGSEEQAERILDINVSELIDQASMVCVEEEYQLCVEQHIIHRMIPVWLAMERQGQLLGSATPEDPSPAAKRARELAEKCLSFELEFESTGKSMDTLLGFEGAVSASVPLRLDASEVSISGSGTLVNEHSAFYAEGCSVDFSVSDGTFEVFSLGFDTDLNKPEEGPASQEPKKEEEKVGKVTQIFMHYFPGATSGPLTVTCDDFTLPAQEGTAWFGTFLITHQDEQGDTSTRMTYEANDWTIHGGELFAERSWQRGDASTATNEQGSMKLYHRPGQ